MRRKGCCLWRAGKEEKEITEEVFETEELCTFCTNAHKVLLSSGESSFPNELPRRKQRGIKNSGERIDPPTDHVGSTPTFFYCILTPGSWIL